ncbi:MAG: sugar phosphate isomerase/epimerase family protein [Limisphaerales bacterium]
MPSHIKISFGLVALFLLPLQLKAAPAEYDLFARTNLMAWCIVPFDAKKRGPEERAEMLRKLGIQRLAYDYRAEHIPTFDAEIAALRKHQIELTAWWFPTTMNAEARSILSVLRKNNARTQLWVMGGPEPARELRDNTARVEQEILRIGSLAEAAAKMNCKVGLYNHGGWFGEPTNQLAIIKRLRMPNVGIVYNLHHAHDQLDRFPELLEAMKPHLLAINLNGMVENGDKTGKKILPIGQGTRDLEILRIIEKSGWRGPIGILNHTDEDAEARLQDNIEGLEWLVAQLRGREPGPKPKPRSWQP